MRLLLLSCLALPLLAAEPLPEDRGAVGLDQAIRRLETNVRVLSVTAHPDDEDAGTLTYLARGRGATLTMLILNRGESGANLVSGEFFEGLGALRTGEMLKAAAYYGAAVRFTRFVDYGYSKTVEETFRNWKREEVLADCVRIVREVKPHIILSRFQGTARDGHGNHVAAGLLAQDMFDVAADAAFRPELGAPWAASKLYLGNYRENEAWTLAIDSGQYDPVLGRSYAQLGREGYRWHRSQGMALSVARPGPQRAFYRLAKSRVGHAEKEADIFERLDSRPPEPVREAVAEARRRWPTGSAPALAAVLKEAQRLGDADLAQRAQQALVLALGMELEAQVAPENPPSGPMAAFRAVDTLRIATPGAKFRTVVTPHVRGSEPVELLGQGVRGDTQTPTAAYWRRRSVRDSVYELLDPSQFSQPLPRPPLVGWARFRYRGVEFELTQPVEASVVDPIAGQSWQTLVAGPAVSVRFSADAGILPIGRRQYSVTVNVRNLVFGPARGTLRLVSPWPVDPPAADFAFEREREEANFTFRLQAPDQTDGEIQLRAEATVDGQVYHQSFQPIGQPGTEIVYLSAPAAQVVRPVDVRVAPGLKVGYVMGTGDAVPQGLEQLGVDYELLDAAAIATGDLGRYSTILLGIRAYAARPELKTYNVRLLDYVARGGVLVVQYNTQEFDQNYGPYPYEMTMRAEEVSEEDSPVEILDPADPVFQTPNRITAADFDGWVEQRGSKFLSLWDPRYKPLLAARDTGQAPQRGGWLVARYGRGLYIYCAYAWYRQIPYAVPGAVRIFANLVSLGDPQAPWRRP